MSKKETTSGVGTFTSFGHCSMRGMRYTMEDRHNSIPDITFSESQGAFFGVYDGHGGESVAEFISKALPTHVNGLELTDKNIVDVFCKVDGSINSESEQDCGSTCVTTFLTKSKDTIDVVCANTGDSRAVLYHHGTIVELSHDQKPSLDGEKKRILESGNIVLLGRVNGSLAVSRAFGDFRYKKSKDKVLTPDKFAVTVVPEIKRFTVTDLDKLNFVVLACDGVWDVMKNEDVCNYIVEKLKETTNLETICEDLLTRCIKELGSSDNCTVIIVTLK
jgi:protein phosphatase 2C family protein 2/3